MKALRSKLLRFGVRGIAAIVLCTTHLCAQEIQPVINGDGVGDQEFPWMASLVFTGDDPSETSIFCGATLITDRYVLTAAHCVEGLAAQDIQVVLGRNFLSAPTGEIVSADSILVHPKYWEEGIAISYDIALIKLSRSVSYQPIAIQESVIPDEQKPELSATVLGWGQLDAEYPVLPDELQKAQIPLINDTECKDSLGLSYDPETMLCAGLLSSAPNSGDGIDTCYGDSGGPLVVDSATGKVQVGIVSNGFSCATDKFYGIYTKVSTMAPWIKEHIALGEEIESHLVTIEQLLKALSREVRSSVRRSLNNNVTASTVLEHLRQLRGLLQSNMVDVLSQFDRLTPRKIKRVRKVVVRIAKGTYEGRQAQSELRRARRLIARAL